MEGLEELVVLLFGPALPGLGDRVRLPHLLPGEHSCSSAINIIPSVGRRRIRVHRCRSIDATPTGITNRSDDELEKWKFFLCFALISCPCGGKRRVCLCGVGRLEHRGPLVPGVAVPSPQPSSSLGSRFQVVLGIWNHQQFGPRLARHVSSLISF